MTDRRRLFFALWPPAPVLAALVAAADAVAARDGIRGRRVPAERLHLTLLFLGDLAADVTTRVEEAAGEVRAAPFEWVVDRAGSFRAARVAWLGAASAPAPLAALWRNLVEALQRAGLTPDLRTLAPHVTCWRDARPLPRSRPIEPIRWPVEAFTLVRSVPGPRPEYHVVSQWPLQNGPMASVKTVQSSRRPE